MRVVFPNPSNGFSDNSIDLSDQALGVYFAHISQGENQWLKKLVLGRFF